MTGEILASHFFELDSLEQAFFFNCLGSLSGDRREWELLLKFLYCSGGLNEIGVEVMKAIGESVADETETSA
jgi:hypothetical protein